MTDFAHVRTSTGDQDGLGQRARLLEAGILPENMDPYTDRGQSGFKGSRPGLDKLLSVVQAGDSITVTDLSRLGRSVSNVLTLITELDQRGIRLVILNLGGSVVDTSTATGRFFITVLAALNELTARLISENTKLKLAALKEQGAVLGAPRKLTPAQEQAVVSMRASGVKPAVIAAAMDVSEMTIYRVLKRAS